LESKRANYFSNYISILSVYFLRMMIPFLIIILIGRFYSTEEFGRYAVATAFMGVLGLFLAFGIPNVVSFEIAALNRENRREIAEILKTSLLILVMFSIVGSLFMCIILLLLNYSRELIHIIIALFFGYFFMGLNFVLCGVFIGIKEMKFILPSTIASLVSVIIIVLPAIYFRKPLYLVALLWSTSHLIGFAISFFLIKKKNFWQHTRISWEIFFHLIKRSIGVGLDNVIFKLGSNLTNILLPFYLQESQIGIFNGAFKPFVLLIAGNQITIQFFIPYIASRVDEEKQKKEEILHIFHKINAFFTLSIIVMPLFFSVFLNRFFFGNKLLESISYMVLLTAGYLIYYLPPYSTPLKAFRMEWKVIYSSITQVIVNLLAIIILVPKYGIKGAVYAVIMAFASYWLVNIILYISAKLRPVSNISNYLFFIAFSLINGLLIQNLFSQKIYSLLLFLAINLLGAYFVFSNSEERQMIFSLLKIKYPNPFLKS